MKQEFVHSIQTHLPVMYFPVTPNLDLQHSLAFVFAIKDY